jgi:tetratricopeptide (TPR) repeat protein
VTSEQPAIVLEPGKAYRVSLGHHYWQCFGSGLGSFSGTNADLFARQISLGHHVLTFDDQGQVYHPDYGKVGELQLDLSDDRWQNAAAKILKERRLALGPYNGEEGYSPEFDSGVINIRKSRYCADALGCESFVREFSVNIVSDPGNASLYFERAMAYRSLSKFKEAIDDLSEAITLDSDPADIYFVRGEIYANSRPFNSFQKIYVENESYDRDKALEDFLECARRKPSSGAFIRLGRQYLELSRTEEAMQVFRKALELTGREDQGSAHMAALYLKTYDLDLALEEYNKLIRSSPARGKAYWYRMRSEVYYALRDYVQAWADMLTAEDMGSTDEFYRQKLKVSSGDTTDEKPLIAQATRAIVADPMDADAYFRRGKLYIETGVGNEAAYDLIKAWSLGRRDAELYFMRAKAYGLSTKALEDLDNALELTPNDPALYAWRLYVYLYLKKYDQAWNDAYRLQEMGQSVQPFYLQKLEAESGRKLLPAVEKYPDVSSTMDRAPAFK